MRAHHPARLRLRIPSTSLRTGALAMLRLSKKGGFEGTSFGELRTGSLKLPGRALRPCTPLCAVAARLPDCQIADGGGG